VSRYTTERDAHQSSLRIVNAAGYTVYQCDESTPEENKEGQVARMAFFQILNPTAPARWVDVCAPAPWLLEQNTEFAIAALNRLLQELAWDAVIHNPSTGVTAK
jgi:hypothetical protein